MLLRGNRLPMGLVAMIALVVALASLATRADGAVHVYKPDGILPVGQQFSSGGFTPSKVFNRISIQHDRAVRLDWCYASGDCQAYFGTKFLQIGTHGVYRQASAKCMNWWTGGNVYGHCNWYD